MERTASGVDTVGVDMGVRSAAGSAGMRDWRSDAWEKQHQCRELHMKDIADSASPQY